MKIYSLLTVALVTSAAQAQSLSQQFPVKGAASTSGAAHKSNFKAKKPAGKPQSALAAKGAFPVIKASDPSLKMAIAATNLSAAQKMTGKNALVVGVVSDIFAPQSGSITLLNFAKDYKTALVGVVKAKDFAKFPNLKTLKGKKVVLQGPIIAYKGKPEIQLAAAGAIRLVR